MQCPGQDSRYWDGAAVFETKCPKCGGEVEFFKDDSTRKCTQCGHRLLNPKIDFGCAAYCPYAEQCLGSLPPELLAKKKALLLERVPVEMKKYFGDDFKRIGHASRVARYAGEIGEAEQANPAVVLAAAYLHDIGIKEAERKYNSTLPRYQHEEGPPVARQILTALAAEPGLIEEVCDIIGHHHHPRSEETVNFKAIYDADLIVNLEEKQKESPSSPEHLAGIVEKSFLTESGRRLARKVLLG
ncbi:MAG: phosphohydrolase [Deltaproteobacteria bacterium RIFOXYD12_FULL_57_12]|nr:MAG: phosphohydrolase [Deltaproteobacteria bacterium RIFOXYD12_FULL_57_12]